MQAFKPPISNGKTWVRTGSWDKKPTASRSNLWTWNWGKGAEIFQRDPLAQDAEVQVREQVSKEKAWLNIGILIDQEASQSTKQCVFRHLELKQNQGLKPNLQLQQSRKGKAQAKEAPYYSQGFPSRSPINLSRKICAFQSQWVLSNSDWRFERFWLKGWQKVKGT